MANLGFDPRRYGNAANPVSQDQFEWIVKLHWPTEVVGGTPTPVHFTAAVYSHVTYGTFIPSTIDINSGTPQEDFVKSIVVRPGQTLSFAATVEGNGGAPFGDDDHDWTGSFSLIDPETGGSLYESPPCSFTRGWREGFDSFAFSGAVGAGKFAIGVTFVRDDSNKSTGPQGAIRVFLDCTDTPGF